MNDGRLLGTGFVFAVAFGIVAALLAYSFAPPIHFPGQWSWLNAWGRFGVTFAFGWSAFVLTLVFTIFAMVARVFAEMGRT